MKTSVLLAAAGIAIFGLGAATTSFADTKAEIDANVAKTMTQFYSLHAANKSLAGKSAGMLIFPKVTKAGIGIAGEHGQGVLQVNGKTVGYYSIGAASVGLTVGAGTHHEVIMFMTKESLDKFTGSDGWSIGADAGITIVQAGTTGDYDTKTEQKPILGFIFGEKGLIGDLSLEGSKISKLKL